VGQSSNPLLPGDLATPAAQSVAPALSPPTFAADQSAGSAVKAVLLQQLDAIEFNQVGVLQRLDSEFLHDLRVATRRTRSVLGQFKEVFPEQVARRYAAGFAKLGRMSGEPRDLDVYLLGFDDLKGLLPEPLCEHLEPLRAELERQREEAYDSLIERLDSRATRKLLRGWRAVLEQPVAERPQASKAHVPIKAMADRRIHRLFRRALRQGRAIEDDSPPDHLHELRKTCKKLRYLMEFFGNLYADEVIQPAIRQLKALQGHLGVIQDVHEQVVRLRRLAEEFAADRPAALDTLAAIQALLAALEGRQEKLRAEFQAHFCDFDQEDNRDRFRQLFKPVGNRIPSQAALVA